MPIPILTEEQIRTLAPHRFFSPSPGPEVDQDVRDHFASIYEPLRDEGVNDHDLSRLATAIYYFRPMLASILKPTLAKNVVEVGCGWGLKALAWADLFKSYVGIELDPHRAAQANASFARFNISNARAIAGNAEAILQEPERHGVAEVDLLVLYAVLEHLTIPERRSILRLAQEVYRRGGHVLVAESPNRLSPFDTHSFQLPFIEWLPIELQEEYVSRSPREDLRAQLDAAPPDGRHEALYRIGRGLSFHEFECFWEKDIYEGLCAVRDGFSASMLNLEPLRREEVDLMRFCEDNGVNIHRFFQRYWLYGFLAQRPVNAVKRRARYLPPHEIGSGTMRKRQGHWVLDEVRILSVPWNGITIEGKDDPDGEAVLLIDLGRSSRNIGRSSGIISIERRRTSRQIDRKLVRIDELAKGRLPTWHNQVALPLGPLEGGTFRIKIKGDGLLRPGWLTCNGALIV